MRLILLSFGCAAVVVSSSSVPKGVRECVESFGCGEACGYPCPFGFPCIDSADCLSASCTAHYCDAGRPASGFKPVNKPTPPAVDSFMGKLSYYGDSYNTDGRIDPPPLGPENGGWYGSCYDAFGPPKNWNKFAALNGVQYQEMGAARACGKCAKINYKGRSTTVQIVDLCPGCAHGGLDISHAAMGDLVGSYDRATELGVVYNATWSWVDCSTLSVDRTFRGPSYIIGST